MLIEKQLFGTVDKVAMAIARLKQFEPPEGYYLAFSGGKDSVVIHRLAVMSGVKFDAHYNDTTIDPPEIAPFIKKHYADVDVHKPQKSFFKELLYHGFPLRQSRWCCQVLKEGSGEQRFVLTGIRWAESFRRSNRKMTEICSRRAKRFLHPIIDWTDEDVWQFIHENNVPYSELYDRGRKRIGCLFCPMGRHSERLKDLQEYPKFANAFRIGFRKLYAKRKQEGKTSVDRWKDGDEMFDWWVNEQTEVENPDQTVMFE